MIQENRRDYKVKEKLTESKTKQRRRLQLSKLHCKGE